MSESFYKVLGVSRNATDKEIKSSYRKLAIKYHPDKNPDDEKSEDMFKTVASAYEVLGDKDKKRKYDSMNHSDYVGGGSSNQRGGFRDMESMFNEMRKQQEQEANKNDSAVGHKITLTMQDVYNGVTKTFKYNHYDKCKPCEGKGGEGVINCENCDGNGVVNRIINTQQGRMQQTSKCGQCKGKGVKIKTVCNSCSGNGIEIKSSEITVDIPRNIQPNERLVITNSGSYYKEGGVGMYGDLIIIINIIQEEYSLTSRVDLISDVEIDYLTLVLGGVTEFTTVDGSKINIPIKQFTTLGRHLRIKGKGLRLSESNENRGDQYIIVKIKMPTEISDEEKELLIKLKNLA